MSLFKEPTVIKTSRYNYSGADRLDITVKGQDAIGVIFAPTWDMVMGVKKGNITEEEYLKQYTEILYNIPKDKINHLLQRSSITLVCFCKVGDFCHRYFAAAFLDIKGGNYIGEVTP
jgi:uncharacterized protein (DUF488 family)